MLRFLCFLCWMNQQPLLDSSDLFYLDTFVLVASSVLMKTHGCVSTNEATQKAMGKMDKDRKTGQSVDINHYLEILNLVPRFVRHMTCTGEENMDIPPQTTKFLIDIAKPRSREIFFRIVQSLWGLGGVSTELLSSCQSNFKTIRWFEVIARLV